MKVSIVTPSYNQGQFIKRTLDSVASQVALLSDEIEFEHVIFDGGSTDDTVDVLKNYSSKITWFSEKDNGQSHAVNKGLMQTDGDIIGWLNSDDIYYPGAIKKVVDFFVANPLVDVVYGMAKHIDLDDKDFEDYPTEKWSLKRLKEACFICQPALFFRRRILARSGLLDESLNYCMDYELWMRMACSGARFAYLEETLAGSRLYGENKTLSAPIKVHKEVNDSLKKHFSYVPMGAIINYAYAVVNEELIKSEHPYKFAMRIFVVSIRSAFVWNGRPVKFLGSALLHWGRGLLCCKFLKWRKAL
ncbi:MAG: glycosyltransferase family 2 protein [Legionellaceae bacterium]|nr:glycosyltransferase family 2 protein [Legionellaceae bacterium]